MAPHSSFGDMFLACGAYLDVPSCKEFSSIFTEASSGEVAGYDVREEPVFVQESRRVDDVIRSDWSDERDISTRSLSTFLLPLMPQSHLVAAEGQGEIDGDAQEIESRRIFRSKRVHEAIEVQDNRNETNTSEYTKFCKISRCTAWSEDAADIGSAMLLDQDESNGRNVDLVHWESRIIDPIEIKGRFDKSER